MNFEKKKMISFFYYIESHQGKSFGFTFKEQTYTISPIRTVYQIIENSNDLSRVNSSLTNCVFSRGQ